jgi:hypothetical protein
MFLPFFSLPPSSATCFVYNHFTIATKSATTPWVCNVGTSWEGSRMTSFWVCLFLGNNTHKVHCHDMKFDNSREGVSLPGSSFLPPLCVFLCLPIYSSILPSPSPSPLCYCKNKGKMWRSVTVRKVGALPAPPSFPLVFILFTDCPFVLSLPSPCLCCVVGTKVKGSCWQQSGECQKSTSSLGFFLHPRSICLHVYCHRHLFYNQEGFSSLGSFSTSLIYLFACLSTCMLLSPLFCN